MLVSLLLQNALVGVLRLAEGVVVGGSLYESERVVAALLWDRLDIDAMLPAVLLRILLLQDVDVRLNQIALDLVEVAVDALRMPLCSLDGTGIDLVNHLIAIEDRLVEPLYRPGALEAVDRRFEAGDRRLVQIQEGLGGVQFRLRALLRLPVHGPEAVAAVLRLLVFAKRVLRSGVLRLEGRLVVGEAPPVVGAGQAVERALAVGAKNLAEVDPLRNVRHLLARRILAHDIPAIPLQLFFYLGQLLAVVGLADAPDLPSVLLVVDPAAEQVLAIQVIFDGDLLVARVVTGHQLGQLWHGPELCAHGARHVRLLSVQAVGVVVPARCDGAFLDLREYRPLIGRVDAVQGRVVIPGPRLLLNLGRRAPRWIQLLQWQRQRTIAIFLHIDSSLILKFILFLK